MADIELTSVDVKVTNNALAEPGAKLPEESHFVKTRYGQIFVTIQGNRSKTPIVTYPDIGLNCNNSSFYFRKCVDLF